MSQHASKERTSQIPCPPGVRSRDGLGRTPQSVAAGFTLVELLVVVTIIVVLLGLLTPAMDQAMYQADLALCSSQQRMIAGGVQLYAFDHRRSYPWRPGVHADDVWWRVHTIYEPSAPGRRNQTGLSIYDDRIPIADYFQANHLRDPLCGQTDISIDGTDADSTVLASYAIWYGLQFSAGGGAGVERQRGMLKVGDRLQWNEYRFNLLIGDRQLYNRTPGGSFSHPDRAGVLKLQDRQDQGALIDADVGSVGGTKMTYTHWNWVATPQEPETLDMNHAWQDGSVHRYANLTTPDIYNAADPGDYPLRAVPWLAQSGFNRNLNQQIWIPAN